MIRSVCSSHSERCYLLPPGVAAATMAMLDAYELLCRRERDRALETIRGLEGDGCRSEALLGPCRRAVEYAESVTRFVARVRGGRVDATTLARAVEAVKSLTAANRSAA
jgi:hypothetical protein